MNTAQIKTLLSKIKATNSKMKSAKTTEAKIDLLQVNIDHIQTLAIEALNRAEK